VLKFAWEGVGMMINEKQLNKIIMFVHDSLT
jgi:hypothetical protein